MSDTIRPSGAPATVGDIMALVGEVHKIHRVILQLSIITLRNNTSNSKDVDDLWEAMHTMLDSFDETIKRFGAENSAKP